MIPCICCLAEVSGESGDESSGEDEMVQVPIKPKPLQARHSLLDNLVEEPSSKTTSDPASKRLKRDDNVVSDCHIISFMVEPVIKGHIGIRSTCPLYDAE